MIERLIFRTQRASSPLYDFGFRGPVKC
jgi:hypothetical protein